MQGFKCPTTRRVAEKSLMETFSKRETETNIGQQNMVTFFGTFSLKHPRAFNLLLLTHLLSMPSFSWNLQIFSSYSLSLDFLLRLFDFFPRIWSQSKFELPLKGLTQIFVGHQEQNQYLREKILYVGILWIILNLILFFFPSLHSTSPIATSPE